MPLNIPYGNPDAGFEPIRSQAKTGTTGADFQAMLRKFVQYAQKNPGEFSGGPQLGAIGQQPSQQNMPGMGAPPIGSNLAAQASGPVPLPQERPNIPPQGMPQVPMPQPRPPMPMGAGLAGTGGGMPPPGPSSAGTPPIAQQAAPNLFQRSAMMQTDPNTGQPINPQAAALAQALMQQRGATA